MKVKNIFKTLAFAMLMPAMLLTTACSNEDDVVNNEPTAKKGYALPVTVNVTRQGDATTRATYNESTRKLEFSAGDKLFVEGSHIKADRFAGTLTWQSGGTFSGTIYTESPYEGTIDDLLNGNYATLLPAGYESTGYLTISDDGYQAYLEESPWKSFATSKAAGVEQLSFEHGEYTSGTGFKLEPQKAILNFTITGLTPSTIVTAALSDDVDWTPDIEGEVTTDGSGNATFAIGLEDSSDLNEFSLTVAGNPVTLVSSSKVLAAGKIYNITRKITDLSTITANYTASNGETLTGTLGSKVKISIADGATVILNNATISYSSNGADYAGLTLLGDGTIVLADGTTNTVVGGLDGSGYSNWPGIYVPEGKTLTINGNTGVLNARRGGNDTVDGSPAGIGASWANNCGNIVINGGVINAIGGAKGAGIGGTFFRSCGDITINGGTITATGNKSASGIGLGGPVGKKDITNVSCGNITITGGTVNATGGWGGAGIGTGFVWHSNSGTVSLTCGNILISGGTVTATGGAGAAGIGTGGVKGGSTNNCGNITITDGVTSVTVTKGSGNYDTVYNYDIPAATNSIGKGSNNGTCGTVTIGGNVGAITTSPYTYQP